MVYWFPPRISIRPLVFNASSQSFLLMKRGLLLFASFTASFILPWESSCHITNFIPTFSEAIWYRISFINSGLVSVSRLILSIKIWKNARSSGFLSILAFKASTKLLSSLLITSVRACCTASKALGRDKDLFIPPNTLPALLSGIPENIILVLKLTLSAKFVS